MYSYNTLDRYYLLFITGETEVQRKALAKVKANNCRNLPLELQVFEHLGVRNGTTANLRSRLEKATGL